MAAVTAAAVVVAAVTATVAAAAVVAASTARRPAASATATATATTAATTRSRVGVIKTHRHRQPDNRNQCERQSFHDNLPITSISTFGIALRSRLIQSERVGAAVVDPSHNLKQLRSRSR